MMEIDLVNITGYIVSNLLSISGARLVFRRGKLPQIVQDEINEKQGAGANYRVSDKRYRQFSKYVFGKALIYKHAIREQILGYYIKFLKTHYHLNTTKRHSKVKDFLDVYNDIVDHNIYPLALLMAFQEEAPNRENMLEDNKEYLLLTKRPPYDHGEDIFKGIDQKCPVMSFYLDRYKELINEIFPVLETQWFDNDHPYSEFRLFCYQNYMPLEIFRPLIVYLDDVRHFKEGLIDSIKGPGFNRGILNASWLDAFLDSGVLRLLEDR